MGRSRVLVKASAAKELEAIGVKKDRHRIRIGDHRVDCAIEDSVLTLRTVKVGHRREAHR